MGFCGPIANFYSAFLYSQILVCHRGGLTLSSTPWPLKRDARPVATAVATPERLLNLRVTGYHGKHDSICNDGNTGR